MKMRNRNTIVILLASLFSPQMHIPIAVLASIYTWFSEIDPNLVILIYSVPNLISALAAIALGPVMRYCRKKYIVMAGQISVILGGAIIVFGGSVWFSLALFGNIFCGIGYAFILNASNAMLLESNPQNAATNMAANSAAISLGGMIITALSGVLAQDGNWTRAYLLSFPAVITFVLFVIFYRDENKSIPFEKITIENFPLRPSPYRRHFRMGFLILFVFFLIVVGISAWSINYTVYVITEKQIGNTVQTGFLNMMTSLGGVIGGFFLSNFLTRKWKKWTVPICCLILAIRHIPFILEMESMALFCVTTLLSMAVYGPIYGEISVAAEKLMPENVGISAVNAVLGIGGFVAPYILNFVARLGDGTTEIKFTFGLICLVAASVLSYPVIQKAKAVETI